MNTLPQRPTSSERMFVYGWNRSSNPTLNISFEHRLFTAVSKRLDKLRNWIDTNFDLR